MKKIRALEKIMVETIFQFYPDRIKLLKYVQNSNKNDKGLIPYF